MPFPNGNLPKGSISTIHVMALSTALTSKLTGGSIMCSFIYLAKKKASINTKGFVVILKVRQYESFYKTLKVVRTPPFVDSHVYARA